MQGDRKNYLYDVRWQIAGLFGLALFTHGSILYSQRIRIDTDFMMQGIDNFTELGRQGLIWVAKILRLDWFNLYYAQVLTIFFLVCMPVAFGYLFHTAAPECPKWSLLVLGMNLIVSANWTEQMYFLNQSAQVLFGCCLIPLSVLLLEKAWERGVSWKSFLMGGAAVGLMQMSFACYQVLMPMYVLTVAVLFILQLRKEKEIKPILLRVGYHAIVFLLGIGIYYLIAKTFYLGKGEYLQGQIAWKNRGLRQIAGEILSQTKEVLAGGPVLYSGLYGFFFLLLLIVTVAELIRKRGEGRLKSLRIILLLAVETAVFLLPFSLYVIFGGKIAVRMQLLLPLAQGCMVYILMIMLADAVKAEKKVVLYLARAVGVILLFLVYQETTFQLSYCTRLYYTDEWIYQYDKQAASDIYHQILSQKRANDLDDSFDEVLFLGYPMIPYNGICFKGDVIGSSSFAYDLEYVNRGRILSFMNNQGYPIQSYFTGGQEAVFQMYFEEYFGQIVDEMPSYPAEGYAQYMSNEETGQEYLVIKLGPHWRLFGW